MTDRKEEIKKLKIEIKQKSEIKIQMTNLKKKKKTNKNIAESGFDPPSSRLWA